MLNLSNLWFLLLLLIVLDSFTVDGEIEVAAIGLSASSVNHIPVSFTALTSLCLFRTTIIAFFMQEAMFLHLDFSPTPNNMSSNFTPHTGTHLIPCWRKSVSLAASEAVHSFPLASYCLQLVYFSKCLIKVKDKLEESWKHSKKL